MIDILSGEPLAELRRERDEAFAEIERLRAENQAQRERIDFLEECFGANTKSGPFREKSARALELRRNGMPFRAIGKELGVTTTRAQQLVGQAIRLSNPRWYDILPARVRSFLQRYSLTKLSEREAAVVVARLSLHELLRLQNIGKVGLNEIFVWLTTMGLKLRVQELPCDRCRKYRSNAARKQMAEMLLKEEYSGQLPPSCCQFKRTKCGSPLDVSSKLLT